MHAIGVDGQSVKYRDQDNNILIELGRGSKLGLYGVAPVVRPTALTAQNTSITYTAPGTADFAIQNLTSTSPFGFVSQDEGNTVLQVILNLQTRVAELETKLRAVGALT